METETKGIHSFVALFRRRQSPARPRAPTQEQGVTSEKKRTKNILGIPISTPRRAASRSTSPTPRSSRIHQGLLPNLDALPVSNKSFPPSQISTQIHSPQPHPVHIPAIVQTPPTPNRPGSSPPRLGRSRRKDSIDSAHWYQPMSIDTVAEERLSKGEVVPGDVHKVSYSTEKVTPSSPPKVSQATKQRRHGSFDFERVGFGPNGISIRDTHASSLVTSPGLAGIGTTLGQLPRKEVSHPSPTSAHSSAQNLMSGAATIPDYTSASSTQSHEHSQSTHHSASTNGHKSSWGRSAGKKSSANQTRTKKRRIPSHLTFLGTSHPPFEFEPAVPSPTSPTTATVNGKRGREKPTETRQPTPESPSPNKGSVGFKSGAKGRSLDLNLGLSWAPTKLREDALLPSPFGKSLSASSRASVAKKIRDVALVDEMGVTKTTDSKAGRDVAEVFRQVLDDAAFASFKKYVHRFDAHDIPFDGPNGIVCRVERLLERSPRLSPESRRELVDSFIRVVLQNA